VNENFNLHILGMSLACQATNLVDVQLPRQVDPGSLQRVQEAQLANVVSGTLG
jgi:hypothetical protein